MKKKTTTKKEVTQKKFYTTYIPELDDSIADALARCSFEGLPKSSKDLEKQAISEKYSNSTITHYYVVEVVVNVSGPKKIPEPAKKNEQKAPKIVW